MANSACPKCDSNLFEIKDCHKVEGTQNVIKFIQCSSCGAVIGTHDKYNIPTLLEKLADKLGINNFFS